jgi:hypothetical protein
VLVVVAVVLVTLAAGGAYAWQRAGESQPVPEAAAVAEFRAEPGPVPASDDPPAPGVYVYALSGWECGGLGPVCLHRELPATGQLTIRRDGGGIEERLLISEQHGEGRSLVRGDDGWRLAEQWSDLTFLGLGRETRDAATPHPLVLPDDLTVGRSWSQRYALRSVPVEIESRVLRRETVEVGGEPVDAVVIQSATTMGGTTWYAPALGLDVRRQVARRIDGSFRYELELDARLTGVIPAR